MNTVTAAIILGGSHVWREDSLESLCPRLLLPMLNAPLVGYALDWLRNAGLSRIVICANDATRFVRACFGDGRGHGVDLYYFEDLTPRGPAGCMRDAADLVNADQYVVLEGSVLPALDLRALLRFHERMGAAATVAVHPCGSATDAAEPTWSPAGIYVLSRDALGRVPALGYQDIKEVFIPRLYGAREWVVAYPAEATSPRLRGLGSYLALQGWLMSRMAESSDPSRPTPGGYRWCGPALVHETARVAGSARLVGPVMVGPGTQIEEQAIVVGPSVVGQDGGVSAGALVDRCVLWDDCTVQVGATLDRCLMATGSTVRSGAALHGTICPPGSATRRGSPRAARV